jgi:anaerobic magnesium-protoporphyrin IX monomethyl ester cyclase
MDTPQHVTLIEAGSPGLNIYSHVAMGRGLPILATVLRDRGYPVTAFVEDISGKGSIDWEVVRNSSVVGFSAITCTLTRTAELIAEARRVNPDAAIVLGGPEPTCAPARAFDAGVDFVIRGEAEFSLPLFLEALRGRGIMRDIPGIVWKDAGGLRYGPPAVQLTRDEINALPLVDTSLVHGYPGHTTASVWRSRGCPERCEFCEVHELWPRYVLRDEETSVRELVSRRADGKGGAFLVDDNSAANKPSFKRFLRGAIEHGYDRPLAVQLRADAVFDKDGRLDHELLGLLRDVAPVTMLCIGVESASNEDLAAVGKGESAERMASALKAMKRYGLIVHGMMIAFANDAADTLKRNGAYARKHVTSLQYLFEVPLPGTKRTAEHETAGRIMWRELTDLKFLDGMHVAVRPDRISAREMQDIVTAQYRRFYSRGRVLAAFLNGLFLRRRSLPPGQRMRLRELHGLERVRKWAWLHLQFKFAPWALLRIGRKRVLDFMRDPEYLAYLKQLDG